MKLLLILVLSIFILGVNSSNKKEKVSFEKILEGFDTLNLPIYLDKNFFKKYIINYDYHSMEYKGKHINREFIRGIALTYSKRKMKITDFPKKYPIGKVYNDSLIYLIVFFIGDEYSYDPKSVDNHALSVYFELFLFNKNGKYYGEVSGTGFLNIGRHNYDLKIYKDGTIDKIYNNWENDTAQYSKVTKYFFDEEKQRFSFKKD